MSDSELHPLLPPEPEGLPEGWTSRTPDVGDVDALAELVAAEKQAVTGSGSPRAEVVAGESVGEGSWTRRQRVLLDGDRVRGWVRAHDRAAGRTNVELALDPELPADVASTVAAAALDWAEEVSLRIARDRGLGGTLLDASIHERDARARAALEAAGYRRTRNWLQMSRPVVAADADLLEEHLREGVRIRSVDRHEDGSPVARDLQTVHRMLEESFADHFNSYRESFPEFLHRLRQDPGHRWDHWWIAEVEEDGEWFPGGALAGTITTPDDGGVEGSYVEYIGVHRLARGRGVAKSLLHAAMAEAAQRGHNRIGLEVDDDSPTGADGIYRSMGWEVTHRTESWHKEARIPGADEPVPEPKGDLSP